MSFNLGNCVTPIVGVLRDCLLKHVMYVVQVGDNVEKLKQQIGDLEAKGKTVLEAIELQERITTRKRTEEVKNWLEKVANILDSSKVVQSDYDKRNFMLFDTNCSFNCCSDYSISKSAFNLQEEVRTVMGQIDKITDYTAEKVPSKVQRMNTTTESSTNSQLELYQQKALSFIEDDTHGTLGICGMGGIGKTTLLKLINNSLEVNKFYCIFVVASKGCTKQKLQELIVDNLKLQKAGDLSKKIYDCLENKDFVLLLDDLWDSLDLKDIGIPHPLGVRNGYKRKVVLTTRFQNVCGNMGTGRNIINVECLKWDEAWALFEKNVGHGVIDSTNPRIRMVAENVARECDGHPLTLITVGRAMSQNETVDMWEDALKKLQASQLCDIPDIQGMGDHPHTLSLLSVSYGYLKTTILKECFLLCALWPEDASISHESLIRCWMGHGLLDGFDNIGETYREGRVVIDTLLKACLLEKDGAHRVKMHDLTRDMALWVARDRGANKKRWLVLTDGNKTEEMVLTPEAHKVSIRLWLSRNKAVEGLFTRNTNWPHLTTLILVAGLSAMRNKVLVNLQYCSELKYLDVSGRLINSLPVEICTLHKLEYLNLFRTGIKKIPWELKNLTNLKYLLLGEVSEIPDGVISSLASLLVLEVYCQGNELSNMIIDEVAERMDGQLKALGIRVYTASSIEKLARLSGSTAMTFLHITRMKDCTTSIPLLSDNFLRRPHMHSHLKSLRIEECDSLEEIVMVQGGTTRSSCCFTETMYLQLWSLIVLKEIVWNGVKPADVFPRLRDIYISDCHQLEHVSWVAHLPCLMGCSLSKLL